MANIINSIHLVTLKKVSHTHGELNFWRDVWFLLGISLYIAFFLT